MSPVILYALLLLCSALVVVAQEVIDGGSSTCPGVCYADEGKSPCAGGEICCSDGKSYWRTECALSGLQDTQSKKRDAPQANCCCYCGEAGGLCYGPPLTDGGCASPSAASTTSAVTTSGTTTVSRTAAETRAGSGAAAGDGEGGDDAEATSLTLIIGVAGAVILLIASAVLVLCVLAKKRQKKATSKHRSRSGSSLGGSRANSRSASRRQLAMTAQYMPASQQQYGQMTGEQYAPASAGAAVAYDCASPIYSPAELGGALNYQQQQQQQYMATSMSQYAPSDTMYGSMSPSAYYAAPVTSQSAGALGGGGGGGGYGASVSSGSTYGMMTQSSRSSYV